MDYGQFNSLLANKGLTTEPAFNDVNVAIEDLPPEYRNRNVLGLYYPDEQTIVVPPNADEETVLHELGHRKAHYYHDDLSEKSANQFMNSYSRRQAVTRSPVMSGLGTYAVIYNMEAIAFAPQGTDVIVSLIIRNAYTEVITVKGVIEYEVNGEINPVDYTSPQTGDIAPGQTLIVQAHFTMVGSDVKVYGRSLYYIGNDQYYEDGSTNIKVEYISEEIPPGYTYTSRIVYPDAAMYNGTYEVCLTGFTAPLTVVPGVSWIVDKLLATFVSACLSNDAIPLEMRIFTKPAQLGSTNYLIELLAYSTVVTRRNPVMAAPAVIAWPAILIIISVALIILMGLAILFVKVVTPYSTYKSQTTVQPQTETLPPGKTFSNLNTPVTVTDLGGGNTTITDKAGNKQILGPNESANVPIGSTTVPGSKGAKVDIPGYSQYIESSAPANTFGNVVKWVAIGGIILVVGVVAIGAFQTFGKRELYHY